MLSYCLPPVYAAHLHLRYKKIMAENPELAGHAVFCPCCGSSFSHWKIFRRRRKPIQCFTCDSVDRHRHLWLQLLQLPDFFTTPKCILHFAPEVFFKEVFGAHPLFEYEDADVDPALATYQIDITGIDRPDDCFDAIFCSHVLEHVGDDRKGMAEIFRVLKPGGTAFIITPADHDPEKPTMEDVAFNTSALRMQHYGHPEHVRTYGRNDFVARLREAGLGVEARTVDMFGSPERIAPFGIGDVVYLCRKEKVFGLRQPPEA